MSGMATTSAYVPDHLRSGEPSGYAQQRQDRIDHGEPGEDRLCAFCGENPAEPGVPCCDNGFCKAEALAEATS